MTPPFVQVGMVQKLLAQWVAGAMVQSPLVVQGWLRSQAPVPVLQTRSKPEQSPLPLGHSGSGAQVLLVSQKLPKPQTWASFCTVHDADVTQAPWAVQVQVVPPRQPGRPTQSAGAVHRRSWGAGSKQVLEKPLH